MIKELRSILSYLYVYLSGLTPLYYYWRICSLYFEDSVCKKHKGSTSNWSCMLKKDCQYAQLLQFNKEVIKCGYEKICCPQLRTSSKSTNKIFSTEIRSTTPTTLTTTKTITTASVKDPTKLVWESELFLFSCFCIENVLWTNKYESI